jgi:hypothetical protein
MSAHRLSAREQVFVHSLQYHGFRFTKRRSNLKYKRGYIIPATRREDSGGVDFWIKLPKDRLLFPIQVTQRGVRLYRKYQRPSPYQLQEFMVVADVRISMKRRMCRNANIVFVLLRDYEYRITTGAVANADIKALRATLKNWRRRR